MQFTASVITGTGNGRKLGFPTLNLNMEDAPSLPEGVYVCFARLGENGIRLPAVVHYGKRPTLNAEPSCEVHVLDHMVSIAPHTVTVELVEMLRPVKDFGSVEKLQAQLHADCAQARSLLCVAC